MNGISAEYIKEFFDKRRNPNPLMVKTRYGKSLGSKFSLNQHKASQWLAQRTRFNSRVSGKP